MLFTTPKYKKLKEKLMKQRKYDLLAEIIDVIQESVSEINKLYKVRSKNGR